MMSRKRGLLIIASLIAIGMIFHCNVNAASRTITKDEEAIMQKKSKVLLLKISDAKAKTLIREAMEKSLPKGQSFSNIQHQAFGYMEVKDLFEQGLVPWYKSGILKIDKKDLEDIAGKVNSKIDLSMPTQATATTASNNEIMENASAAVGKNKRKFQPSSLSAGMQNESTSVNQNVSRVTRRGS